MTLYAIDPGTMQSALVRVKGEDINGWVLPNAEVLSRLRLIDFNLVTAKTSHLVIEQIQSFGMPVGAEVFDTVFWSGRFVQEWQSDRKLPWSLMPRKTVKLALCGTLKAKDPHIRQALIDRYGGPQSVKKGGPLAGIKSHLWAALALAVTYQELQGAAQAPEVTT